MKDIIHKQKYFLFFILLITVIAYISIFSADLLNCDDAPFMAQNQYVKSLSFQNISYIFTHSIEGYHPLSLITLALE